MTSLPYKPDPTRSGVSDEAADIPGDRCARHGASSAGDHVKRGVDVAGAAAVLLLVWPMMLIIALLVRLDSRGPAFYQQERVGKGGRRFKVWKFRTMRSEADRELNALLSQDAALRSQWQAAFKLRRDPRLTRLGGLLRRTSLDELPQLFNVLRGEMSLVGPRPIVENETARFGRALDRYLAVRPGLTGLWQVSGRSQTSYRRRVAMDVYYVRERSLALDAIIIARTPLAVLSRSGAW